MVIDCTGVTAAIEDGLSRVRRGGTFLQFGVAPGPARAQMSPFRIYNDEITVIGSMAVLHSYARAVEMFSAGAVRAEPMVSHAFTLEDYGAAIELFRAGTGRKLQIRPQASSSVELSGPDGTPHCVAETSVTVQQAQASARYQAICEWLATEGRVDVVDIANRLGVAQETIRRDLRSLETAGKLQRVHGGAVRVDAGPLAVRTPSAPSADQDDLGSVQPGLGPASPAGHRSCSAPGG